MASDWCEVRLEDITSKIGDGLHGTPKYDENGDYYFINGNNISNGKIEINDNTKRVSYQEYFKHKKDLNDKTILVSINGTLGNVGIYNNENVCLGKSACYLNIVENVDKQFVKYVLTSSLFQDYIHIYATGTTIKNMGLKAMRDFTFKLPSPEVQKQIADILSSLDDKIALNREMNKTLEAMAQTLFKSWFVDFEPFQEGEFVESELGMIPKGWEVKPLPELIELNPRYSLKKGSEASYLDMANIPTDNARVNEVVIREFSSGSKFMNGDTLLARITPSLENGKTAFVDFLEEDEIGWGSTEFIVMRAKNPLPKEFTYFLARTDDFRNFAISNMSGTSGRQRVPNDCFEQYLMILPDVGTCKKFGEFASSVIKKMQGNDLESKTLSTLRDTLLPKLLSGEIEV